MPDQTSDSLVSRRSLLSRSAASGLSIALIGSVDGLFGTSASAATGDGRGKPGPAGYGPLVPDPAGILSLLAGFTYTIVAKSGATRLESGHVTPDDPDGMAAFVRHGGSPDPGARVRDPRTVPQAALGGTTLSTPGGDDATRLFC